jgi:hypothetical protein
MPESAAFDALAREFFSVWFRYHPGAALANGIGDYAGLLAPQSDDEHAALGSWLETLIVALEELDYAALDPDRRLDAELMFALARIEHKELLERDWRRRDPMRFLPLAEVYRLTLLCPPGLRDDLLTLLRTLPAHLRLAVTQLMPMAELIPPPLVAAAIDAAEAGPAYLRELIRSRWLKAHCHGLGELESAAEMAAAALGQFAASLRLDIAPRAAGACGCGAEHLGFLLRHKHRLDVTPQQVSVLLARLLETAPPPPQTADTAPADASAAALGRECVRQEALLRDRALVTLPKARLRTLNGPACPSRPADMSDAETLPLPDLRCVEYVPDLIQGEGRLYTGHGGHSQGAQGVRLLCCLRLGWGGLHTLTFAGGMAARSLPRLLAGGSSLTAGWPLALTELIEPDLDAEDRSVLEAARRGALERAQLDLDLHLGRVDLGEAHHRAAALGDPLTILNELIRRPGDALAAVLGWQLIRSARARLAATAELDLRRFHDALIARGPIPCASALSLSHGEDFARELTATLFGAAPAVV